MDDKTRSTLSSSFSKGSLMTKLMNVRLVTRFFQATRTEAAREYRQWCCEYAPGTPCSTMMVKTIEKARKLAKDSGFDGILQ